MPAGTPFLQIRRGWPTQNEKSGIGPSTQPVVAGCVGNPPRRGGRPRAPCRCAQAAAAALAGCRRGLDCQKRFSLKQELLNRYLLTAHLAQRARRRRRRHARGRCRARERCATMPGVAPLHALPSRTAADPRCTGEPAPPSTPETPPRAGAMRDDVRGEPQRALPCRRCSGEPA